MPSSPVVETVELVEHERVVPGGTESVRWYVQVGDGWQKASAHSGARSERLPAGPGTVWETRVTIELARGTRVLRVLRAPGRQTRKDAFAYLEREARAPAVREQRLHFEVVERGLLRESTAAAGS